MKRYSLASYSLEITPSETLKSQFSALTVGGQGKAIGEITVAYASGNSLYKTKGYATGGYIHNKSLDRTGTVSITLNQYADEVVKFQRLCNLEYQNDFEGLQITLQDGDGNTIATCEDCFLEGIPDQSFKEAAEDQNWTFTCGKITFVDN